MLEIDEINSTWWTTEDLLSSTESDFNSTTATYVNITEIQESATRNTTPNIPYTVMESLVAIVAVIGNALVIIVFYRERRLRRRTNYYIISLALADFLVGLIGVPFAVLVSYTLNITFIQSIKTFSLLNFHQFSTRLKADIGLPRNLYACLFTLSTLIVLCTISILCLVAVSIDRYWVIKLICQQKKEEKFYDGI